MAIYYYADLIITEKGHVIKHNPHVSELYMNKKIIDISQESSSVQLFHVPISKSTYNLLISHYE